MNWLTWSLLSAVFAALTAILAKIGIAGIDSNLATAVRTTVVVLFAWAIVPLTSSYGAASTLSRRTLPTPRKSPRSTNSASSSSSCSPPPFSTSP